MTFTYPELNFQISISVIWCDKNVGNICLYFTTFVYFSPLWWRCSTAWTYQLTETISDVLTLCTEPSAILPWSVQKLAGAAVWTWTKPTRKFNSRYLMCKKAARPCYLVFERCQYWLWHTAELSSLPKTKRWPYWLADWNFSLLQNVPAPVNWQRKKPFWIQGSSSQSTEEQ